MKTKPEDYGGNVTETANELITEQGEINAVNKAAVKADGFAYSFPSDSPERAHWLQVKRAIRSET